MQNWVERQQFSHDIIPRFFVVVRPQAYSRKFGVATSKHIFALGLFAASKNSEANIESCRIAPTLTIPNISISSTVPRCTAGKLQELGIDLQKDGRGADAMHMHAPSPRCRERNDRRGEVLLCLRKGSVASCQHHRPPRSYGLSEAPE